MSNDQNNQTKPDENIEKISKIAEERRKEAKSVLEQPTPAMVVDIPQSEVLYNLGSKMLPYSQVDFGKLNTALAKTYKLTFVRPQLIPASQQKPINELSDNEIGEIILRHPRVELVFSNGRFPVSRNDFVPIVKISLSNETIDVSVGGVSKVAELVATEVAEALWASTDTEKRWEDIKPHIQVVSYGTATKINLGFPIERLLHPKLRDFIDSQMLDGEKYASQMGAYYTRYDFKPSPNILSVYNLDELHVLFHHFDTETGMNDDTLLRFSLMNRAEAKSGIVVISSELPFDSHVRCIAELKKALEQTP